MTTREKSRLLLSLCCATGLFLTSGCVEGIWKDIDGLEKEALRYGNVVAGAPRISDYNNAELEQARVRLRQSLEKIRSEFDRPPGSEAAAVSLAERMFRFRFGGLLPATPSQETQKGAAAEQGSNAGAAAKPSGNNATEGSSPLRQVLEDLGRAALEPNRIDMTRLRLSTLRFIESELESLNLDKSTALDDRHYRRMQVSVSLTATTRHPARAALVYLDLYPYNGDWWCHQLIGHAVETAWKTLHPQTMVDKGKDQRTGEETGKEQTYRKPSIEVQLSTIQQEKELENRLKGVEKKLDPQVLNKLKEQLGRAIAQPPFPRVEELVEWLSYDDPYGGCHGWLDDNHLLPKLVYVEPLPNPRYVLESGASLSAYDIGAEVPTPKGSVEAAYQSKDISARRETAIRFTALSFAAGQRRAGWFFMKSEGEPEMRPIETRLRMVVDIPRHLKRLEIHVHKAFLGKTFWDRVSLHDDYNLLTSFDRQTRYLHDAREMLNELEAQADRLQKLRTLPEPERAREMHRAEAFPSPTYWQLAKSRVRNLLSLGWSDRLLVDVPEPRPRVPLKYAIHGRVVSSKGASEGFVAVENGIIQGVYGNPDAVPPGFRILDDYKHDFIYPGFIDTHNHPHYNFVPRWNPSPLSTGKCQPFYCNRYEWWKDPDYLMLVKGLKESLDRYGYALDGLIYGQVRALAGGVTTIQGGWNPGLRPTLLRNMWNGYEAQTGRIRELSENGSLERFHDMLESGAITRLFLHVAEGVDEESRAEVDLLEAAKLLKPELVLIHGIRLGDSEFEKIRQSGVHLVWSPSSNLALYGKTMDVAKALAKGVPVALAPDWTITGSSNILQEIQCAHQYGKATGLTGVLTAQQLYLMITETAAQVAGLEGIVGRIAKGLQADLVIMKRKTNNPYENLLVASPEDIRLVLIQGHPAFGEPKAFRLLEAQSNFDFVDLGNVVRAVRLTSEQDLAALPETYSLETVRRHIGAIGTLAPVLESPSCKIPPQAQSPQGAR